VGVQVEALFMDERERRVTLAVDRMAGVPLEERGAVWQPVAYRGRVPIATWWWAASTGKLVGCSSLERQRVVVELDFDRQVECFGGWPVQLGWDGAAGERHTVVADFVARRADGSRVLVVGPTCASARPGGGRGLAWPQVHEALLEACAQAGWRLRVPEPSSPVRAASLLRAAQFRHPRHHDPAAAAALLAAFAVPRPLREGARACGLPVASAQARAYHLVWSQRLRFDWESPLLPTSVVVAAGGGR